MGFMTGFAIYFIIWWTTLFITLPFAARAQVHDGPVTDGTEPAAPVNPQLLKRALWNTVLATIVFGLYWFVFYFLDFGLEDLPDLLTLTSGR